jgi:molybdate transport system regulatory protein
MTEVKAGTVRPLRETDRLPEKPPGISPRMKLFLSTNEMEGIFGNGKCALLNEVRKSGSISIAAKTLGRGYRKAWGDIHLAQKGLGMQLVEIRRGGKGGGTARVTEVCDQLLGAWRIYRQEVEAAMAESFERNLKNLVGGSGTGVGTR